MNTLPSEIITLIFEVIYNNSPASQYRTEGTGALAILHTCRKWREISPGMLCLDQWKERPNEGSLQDRYAKPWLLEENGIEISRCMVLRTQVTVGRRLRGTVTRVFLILTRVSVNWLSYSSSTSQV